MPTFKVKELMIHVLPSDAEELERCGQTTLRGCPGITACGGLTFGGCGGLTFGGCGVTVCQVTALGGCDADAGCTCTYESAGCRSVSCRSPALQLEYLGVLKAELRRTMARLEAEERILDEGLRPRTRDEADELERALTDALEELREQRSGLPESHTGDGEERKGSA